MEFTGKKTERVLMRVTEDMKRAVEALAALEHRDIQDQYRFLIASALQQMSAGSANGTRISSRRLMSTQVFAEERAKALASTAGNFQQLLPGTVGPIPARKRRTA